MSMGFSMHNQEYQELIFGALSFYLRSKLPW
jgi:hypothetical protein